MEIVTQTGYDRSAVRQILQRLRQQGDVVLRPYRSSGHGQVEYIYTLTEKGSDTLQRCFGEFDGLMACLTRKENVEALRNAGGTQEEENTKLKKSEALQDLI